MHSILCLLIDTPNKKVQRHVIAMLCCQFSQWASLMVRRRIQIHSHTDVRPNHTVFVHMLWATRLYASNASRMRYALGR